MLSGKIFFLILYLKYMFIVFNINEYFLNHKNKDFVRLHGFQVGVPLYPTTWARRRFQYLR